MLFPCWRKRFVLFGVGFLVGLLLEVAVIDRGRLAAVYDRLTGERKLKVACVIFAKRDHDENVEASERTWLTKCDEYAGFRVLRGRGYREADGTCDRTRIRNVSAESAWGGLCKVLLTFASSDSDWFILAPDNLLVIVENLKSFVSDLDPGEEHYFGHAVGHYEADYNVFSAGVLISRGTLARITRAFPTETECEAGGKYWRNEDAFLGKYLKGMGIRPKDTRDEDGRGRFHGYNINVLLSPGKLFNRSAYARNALYPAPAGPNCCSPGLITIDATNSDGMYHHYYYVYMLSLGKRVESPVTGPDNGFDWRKFLRDEGYSDDAIDNMSDEEYYRIWADKVPPQSLYDMMRKEFGS